MDDEEAEAAFEVMNLFATSSEYKVSRTVRMKQYEGLEALGRRQIDQYQPQAASSIQRTI
jgi:hypothetical protein